jgi:uncharacterized membrane protein YgcG
MKKNIKLISLFLIILLIPACERRRHSGHVIKNVRVHSYRTGEETPTVDDDIFWYIIFADNNTTYSYNSRTPTSDFRNVTWTQNQGKPSQVQQEEEDEVLEVNEEQLPEEVDETASEESESASDSESESSSDSDSASDSSDGGSDSGGDSGGSDGGGGDGGGGD